MPRTFRLSSAALCVTLPVLLTLAGCSDDGVVYQNPTANTSVTGNWQISSTAPSASRLPSLSGELTGTGAHLTGILHANGASACIAPTASFAVAGSADAHSLLKLTADNLAGGALTVTGTLAADGKSLSDASYTVTGGTCAFSAPAQASAQMYAPVSGAYNGTFADPDGNVLSMTAAMSQSPSADTDGNFTLSGSGSFTNPCFSSPTPLTSAEVTGGNFTFTYDDATTGNAVTASGSVSTDGQTLTIAHWNLTGGCGPDSGTGQLVHQ